MFSEARGLWTYAFARVRGRMVEHVRKVAKESRLVHQNLRYDEAEWERDGDSKVGVVNPNVVSCDAGGALGTLRSMESCMAERHVAILVARLLQRLPETHRHVVMEVLVHQRRVVDVAKAMGEPHWKIRTMLNQATRTLRKALNQEGFTFRELFG